MQQAQAEEGRFPDVMLVAAPETAAAIARPGSAPEDHITLERSRKAQQLRRRASWHNLLHARNEADLLPLAKNIVALKRSHSTSTNPAKARLSLPLIAVTAPQDSASDVEASAETLTCGNDDPVASSANAQDDDADEAHCCSSGGGAVLLSVPGTSPQSRRMTASTLTPDRAVSPAAISDQSIIPDAEDMALIMSRTRKRARASVQCLICFEDISCGGGGHGDDDNDNDDDDDGDGATSAAQYWSCHSGCVVCNDCLTTFLNHKISDKGFYNMQCPGYCQETLAYEAFAHANVDDSIKEQVKIGIALASNPDLIQCPGCSELTDSKTNRPNLQCTHCQTSFCYFHGLEHQGRECEPRARGLKQRIGDQLWLWRNTRKCNQCKHRIQKNGGCNHMTCRCRHEICWRCGKDYYKNGRFAHSNKLFPKPSELKYQCNSGRLWAARVGVVTLGVPVGAAAAGLGLAGLCLYIPYNRVSSWLHDRKMTRRRRERERLARDRIAGARDVHTRLCRFHLQEGQVCLYCDHHMHCPHTHQFGERCTVCNHYLPGNNCEHYFSPSHPGFCMFCSVARTSVDPTYNDVDGNAIVEADGLQIDNVSMSSVSLSSLTSWSSSSSTSSAASSSTAQQQREQVRLFHHAMQELGNISNTVLRHSEEQEEEQEEQESTSSRRGSVVVHEDAVGSSILRAIHDAVAACKAEGGASVTAFAAAAAIARRATRDGARKAAASDNDNSNNDDDEDDDDGLEELRRWSSSSSEHSSLATKSSASSLPLDNCDCDASNDKRCSVVASCGGNDDDTVAVVAEQQQQVAETKEPDGSSSKAKPQAMTVAMRATSIANCIRQRRRRRASSLKVLPPPSSSSPPPPSTTTGSRARPTSFSTYTVV